MGQKVNAHGFRVGVSKPWDAKWYAEKDYAALLNEDVKIREFLKKQLYIAGVSRIEIERSAKRIKLVIHTAKPGMVIGRGGAGIEDIKKALKAFTTKTVDVNIAEIKQAEMDATLVAENVASQLERRIGFRRAMKQCVGRTMRMGAKGIKSCAPAVLAVLKSLAAKASAMVLFPCTRSALTSTMALLKLIRRMAASALNAGFTKVKSSRKLKKLRKSTKGVKRNVNSKTCQIS